jgi:hypothetical protein
MLQNSKPSEPHRQRKAKRDGRRISVEKENQQSNKWDKVAIYEARITG